MVGTLVHDQRSTSPGRRGPVPALRSLFKRCAVALSGLRGGGHNPATAPRPGDIADLLQRGGAGRFADEGLSRYGDEVVMVTGAGGSIGMELCRQLLRTGPSRIVLFEQSELALYKAEQDLAPRAGQTVIVPVLGSVGDPAAVRQVLMAQGVTVVLHAAAYKHVPLVELNPRVGIANNTLGTAEIARIAGECGVRRFVLVSTDKAVRPAGVMGASKRLAELVVQDLAARTAGTVYSIVRFGNVLGSSGSVLPRFLDQIARGGPVTLTDPEVRRYFMTTGEAAHLVLVAGSIAEGGEVFILDMGAPIAIRDLARRLITAAGRRVRDAACPDGDIEIVVTGLRPGEKLSEELSVSRNAQPTSHPRILRVREARLSQIEMAVALRSLRRAVQTADDQALHDALRRWLPEATLAAPEPWRAPAQPLPSPAAPIPEPAPRAAPHRVSGGVGR